MTDVELYVDIVQSIVASMNKCDQYEFDCGNGQCIQGLSVCDSNFDCYNGADELKW